MRRQIPFRLIAIEGIRSVPDSVLTCFQNSTGENSQFPCGGGFADVLLNAKFSIKRVLYFISYTYIPCGFIFLTFMKETYINIILLIYGYNAVFVHSFKWNSTLCISKVLIDILVGISAKFSLLLLFNTFVSVQAVL